MQNWIDTDSKEIDALLLLVNFLVEEMKIGNEGVKDKISGKISQIVSHI